MKALITGAAGFVGKYLQQELKDHDFQTVGLDIARAEIEANLLDKEQIEKILTDVQPDCIFHLAGQSSVGASWGDPLRTLTVNAGGMLNLLEGCRAMKRPVRIVMIGSADEYGKVRQEDCPIRETHELIPQNPYAVSKVTQEQMALLYVQAYGMDIVLTRSFNHTGPGQQRGFVIPDLASQIAAIEDADQRVIYVGNLDARRDFSDVRDVARAYRLLALHGKTGEVYNVGSGQSYRVGDLLERLVAMAHNKIEVQVDKEKFRPIELPVIESDITKLATDTGYSPTFPINRTLADTLQYWRSEENI